MVGATVMRVLILAVLCTSFLASAKGSASHSAGHSGHHSYSHSSGSRAASGVHRDSHGKIKRSHSARSEFQHSHPCPSTGKASGACPGYTVDYVTPLKREGADSAANMQWQTNEAAKLKDRTE